MCEQGNLSPFYKKDDREHNTNMDNDLRNISIDGAPKIGEGAHGEVYRIDGDTIVKVYRPSVSLDAIRREKKLAKWAFVKRLPTAISFDIVRVGDRYGVVYEMLNARSASDYVRESEENLEDFIQKSVELMNRIHSIEVTPGELPDMKKQSLEWTEKCRHYMPSDICDRIRDLTEEIPDSHTLLHADFHLKNIMVSGSSLMLIDMDTLCVGDPIFELATICNSYREFPSIAPEAAMFLGLDVDTAYKIWDRTLEVYMGDADSRAIQDTANKARVLGCVRIIDYMERHKDSPEREQCINTCVRDISDILS